MVILSNVSLFSCCNVSQKPSLSSLSNSPSSRNSHCPLRYSQEGKEVVVSPLRSVVWSLGEEVSKRSLLALVSASLFFVDPALAFKGGGPYGQGVTRGQDLSGKDFSGQTLIRQDFKTSILRQANFKGAKLLGASFFDADLTGADLSEADLRGADFSLANVTKVNLTNANLEGATATGNTSFKGSNITGADFTDVPLRDDQREYLCKIADGVNATTGNATRDTLLCN
ncbi:thylakoid lumenal 15 kDa protein 1, chloroplastic isoform X2 [Arabidopsis lyrata subsp. lyrata]|uniref:thylakoid lumenal 15 kDa protein 1, chloroplastic isoform X2 n=1 Tax=Arabidopsis lyrata subsp. lyrata TaxID=81972 RepID=UPI000A29CF5D|nr:thylakoid lumenal 15 kDa protein 1, chloroplastic isoform X2 [Arabidopsis lyrata subsp. lyrata]|eukprot:XP_020885645.1 thylakoid lumenal 15 kDa protein 1, chloroplastic isoform X2 [Arabidopsis lyrata subsp. lyrata]